MRIFKEVCLRKKLTRMGNVEGKCFHCGRSRIHSCTCDVMSGENDIVFSLPDDQWMWHAHSFFYVQDLVSNWSSEWDVESFDTLFLVVVLAFSDVLRQEIFPPSICVTWFSVHQCSFQFQKKNPFNLRRFFISIYVQLAEKLLNVFTRMTVRSSLAWKQKYKNFSSTWTS